MDNHCFSTYCRFNYGHTFSRIVNLLTFWDFFSFFFCRSRQLAAAARPSGRVTQSSTLPRRSVRTAGDTVSGGSVTQIVAIKNAKLIWDFSGPGNRTTRLVIWIAWETLLSLRGADNRHQRATTLKRRCATMRRASGPSTFWFGVGYENAVCCN